MMNIFFHLRPQFRTDLEDYFGNFLIIATNAPELYKTEIIELHA